LRERGEWRGFAQQFRVRRGERRVSCERVFVFS
jgi:hypothetical protein